MTEGAPNIHATAIAVGNKGLLFVGPSGIGKSAMAFTCLSIARRAGAFAALVADDQVFLHRSDEKVIATCPTSIAGMMEIRGSGIVRMEHVPSMSIDLAIRVVSLADTERLPPESEDLNLEQIGLLPMVRIASGTPDPLAVIGALIPAWRAVSPFW